MREIKFKAVMQRIDGDIYVSDGYGVDSSFLSYLFDFENNRWDRFLEGIITEQRFVELFPDDDEDVKGWSHIENIQYTGLKDKNGKEIYDGDIVYCNDVYYEVVWEASKAVEFKITKQSERKYPDVYKQYFGFNANKHIEVVGSIYENPELLKEDK